MEFVTLTISSTQRYTYKAASTIEMNILGDFLASDVGYRTDSFFNWMFNDTSMNASGTLTALEKEGDYILLTDLCLKEEERSTLKITFDQYKKILIDWKEVSKMKPQEIIIKYENNQFTMESRE